MLFSIIVPIYNMEEYLSSCIDSILNQTYTQLEVILVNDGSTDRSGEICNIYALKDDRIKVIHKENGGLPSERNAGIEIAEGNYITFVDSDDLISNDLLNQIEKLKKYDADIIQYHMKRFKHQKNVELNHSEILSIHNQKIKWFSSKDSLVSFYTNGQITSTVCNKFFKNSLLSNIRFDDKARYFAEDVLFIVPTLLEANIILDLDYQGYYYRITPNSMVTMGLNFNKFESSIYVYSRNRNILKKSSKKIYRLADQFLCSSLINWRIRKSEIIEQDKEKIDIMLRKFIRNNAFGFLKNPIIRSKYKILILFSMGSLRFIDVYYRISKLTLKKRYKGYEIII